MRKLGWREGGHQTIGRGSILPYMTLVPIIAASGAGVAAPCRPHPAFLRVQWQSHCRGENILTLVYCDHGVTPTCDVCDDMSMRLISDHG